MIRWRTGRFVRHSIVPGTTHPHGTSSRSERGIYTVGWFLLTGIFGWDLIECPGDGGGWCRRSGNLDSQVYCGFFVCGGAEERSHEIQSMYNNLDQCISIP